MTGLYVFVDEAGEFNFSPNGSRHFVLTALSAFDIEPCVAELYALKHRLIRDGHEVEYFHASEDRQVVRDGVFSILHECSHVRVDAIIADKPRANPSIYPPEIFYLKTFQPPLRYVLRQRRAAQADRIVVFTDTLPVNRKREAVLKGLKENIRNEAGKKPFSILSHQSRSHPYLQLADYCSWAIYVKWERGELRPFERIQHLVKSEFEIFNRGDGTRYYEIA
ncbi:MAG TPA: DUF3800 domain-containing protein [Dehalococcoidia bacterium]|nr:DUF3800 domain-containing protein [Dehalococcoidia bacterium]